MVIYTNSIDDAVSILLSLFPGLPSDARVAITAPAWRQSRLVLRRLADALGQAEVRPDNSFVHGGKTVSAIQLSTMPDSHFHLVVVPEIFGLCREDLARLTNNSWYNDGR